MTLKGRMFLLQIQMKMKMHITYVLLPVITHKHSSMSTKISSATLGTL